MSQNDVERGLPEAGRESDAQPCAPQGLEAATSTKESGVFLEGYERALKILFANGAIDPRIKQRISKATLSRIKKDQKYAASVAIQQRIIDLVCPEPTTLYGQLAGWFEQDVSPQSILEGYSGTYRYFRFAQPVGVQPRYVAGWIEIGADSNGDPQFQHWSHDHPRERKPEHTGYVLKYGHRVTFVGVRTGVMRLAICKAFTGRRSEEVMPGIVASVRAHMLDPFAALFVLVHVDNQTAIEALQPLPDRTVAPSAFYEMSKGQNGNFITIA